MSESLRLLGYWIFYFGAARRVAQPLFQAASDYLFDTR